MEVKQKFKDKPFFVILMMAKFQFLAVVSLLINHMKILTSQLPLTLMSAILKQENIHMYLDMAPIQS